MLVNCPKCGFSQPNDQYCAQCGVDMQSFKPKELPLLNRILGNTALQVTALFIAAVFVGQYIFQSQQPQSWVQKIAHFKGFNKSTKLTSTNPNDNDEPFNNNAQEASETSSASKSALAEGLQSREFSGKGSVDATAATGATAAPPAGSQHGAQDLSAINFKITYAEISAEMLAKWVLDSSRLGFYQNLREYSAGILYDYKKRGETLQQSLKAADLKLSLGASTSNLSGIMSEDGSQMLGLMAAVEYKSNENEIIQGTINITRSGTTTEVYPAEFALPKGAVFFMVGAVKRGLPASERAKLDMPPFQIYKSPDFMTRKTEFVIILEPDYK